MGSPPAASRHAHACSTRPAAQHTKASSHAPRLHPQLSLVLIDEVHLLHEAGRGASLEAGTVCRIKMLGGLPEMAGVRRAPPPPRCA